jgi:hypothetical protein
MKGRNITKAENMVAFDLNKAMKGAKIVNKMGVEVKFITVCNDGKILAQVQQRFVSENYNEKFYPDGKKYRGIETNQDLMLVAE